jgi:DNA-binding NarL/FixJ family response regulator
MKPVTVFLVDDHPVVLAGIRALLSEEPDFELVGEAADGETARQMICSELPDVAIIDISIPKLNGVDLARALHEHCPAVKLLVMTVHEDRAYVRKVLDAGARGYVLKRSVADDLTRALRAVAEGGLYLDPQVAQIALARDGDFDGEARATGEPLSQRETEVLRLTAQGLTNKETAYRLSISMKTVETYKSRAAEKLGLHSRAEIVRFGVSQGWLDDLNE